MKSKILNINKEEYATILGVIFLKKRALLFLLVLTLITVGVTGCMDEKNNTSDDNVKADIIDALQLQYGKKFKIIETKEGGVTIGGKIVPEGNLIECLDDGTKFKCVLHDDGEVDNYYVNMKLGNDYYNDFLKKQLDEVYGAGNYVCQVLLFPDYEPYSGEELEKYRYEKDSTKQVGVFLGVNITDFDLEKESKKVANIYNSIENFDMKDMQIGFFTKIPSDVENFLVYETTGANNTFDIFYLDYLEGLTIISSSIDGKVLSAQQIEEMHLSKAKLEEE